MAKILTLLLLVVSILVFVAACRAFPEYQAFFTIVAIATAAGCNCKADAEGTSS